MYTEIIKETIYKSAGRVLPWLQKKIYPEDEFKKDIEIDVRSVNPLAFCLTCNIPTVTLYLQIRSKSQYLEITIEKLFFDIWIRSDKGNQPVIHQGMMPSHQRIGKKGTEELYWKTELNPHQIEFLKGIKDSKELYATLHIKYTISSKVHEITDAVDLNDRQCRIS